MNKTIEKKEKLINLGFICLGLSTLVCASVVIHIAVSINNIFLSCVAGLGGVLVSGLSLGLIGEKLACYEDALKKQKAYNELQELTDEEKEIVKEISQKKSVVEAVKLTSNIVLLEDDYDLLKKASSNNKITNVISETENDVIREVRDKENFDFKEEYKEEWKDSKEYTKQKLLRRREK